MQKTFLTNNFFSIFNGKIPLKIEKKVISASCKDW